ncbi:uncharacterized protein B4U79_01145 [Dinothrombium tinctorium]|uniref:USP domain-containing protein n=1 Tax=Dinothrombium tinctorium TaxID=1965070 RepID=A0A3S3QWP7_9ACAR|nr:uncharacterized protein B4U79_01145 [Dinothrombium tinctorium]
MGLESCIFCALKELFTQFQYSRETALPPDSLRRALAETFSDQRRFQLGFMDDAAECFENMLLRLHSHLVPQEPEDRCSAPHCISHQKFAMNLVEQIICTSCGATSEPLPFTQMVHYVSTPALCHQAKHLADSLSSMSFGELLKSAGALGDIRDCPKSCGARIHIKKTLYNKPDIVSIGLVWDSERPNINHITDVFRVIGTSLRLQDVFDDQYNGSKAGLCKSLGQKSGILQLVGLVTYYGKHFSTFFYHTKLAAWIYFDDATVREIGPHWEQVIEKCVRGHFQPLLLLYSNPNGTTIDTSTAPKTITMIASKSSSSNNGSSMASKRNGSYIPKQNIAAKPMPLSMPSQVSIRPMRQLIQSNLLRSHRQSRPGSVDDLLNSASASEDVPDSPLTKSSTSSAYFSDIGEVDSGYISRQTVENILNFQRSQQMRQRTQRSSSSSIDSIVDMNAKAMKATIEEAQSTGKVCSLQRRDSGNSSNSSAGGDRNSSSSGSSVSSDNTFFGLSIPVKRALSNLTGYRYSSSTLKDRNGINSDYGYDSFSLSSSDSYPATGGPSSPIKHNQLQHPRLSQIPEDVQLMELINNSNLQDCDKLCSEADLLLLKSHEKEREGDIRVAAILSDSAAQKARSAMDAPYSNPQALIAAKIKHSMCVMRSASLHRRVKEAEAEEKRRLKAEALEIQHSRQGSRDSNSGKHSRQSSKDGTLKETKKEVIETQSVKAAELYGTLPKKNARKKLMETANGVSSASLRIKEERRNSIPSIIDSLRNSRRFDKHNKDVKSDVESVCSSHHSSSKKYSPKASNKDVECSDYYSEYESVKSPSKIPVQKSSLGSNSCRENDIELYGEFSDILNNKKQNRVRRKLLIGGFMKRKNRSLPDLREGSNQEQNDQEIKAIDDSVTKTVAQVSRRGFHKIHGLGEKGIYQRTSLIKVNTPLVDRMLPKSPPKSSDKQVKCATTPSIQSSLSEDQQHSQQHPTPPPPPEVIPFRKSSSSPSFGIDPNEELPPPPEDFLLDLRENHKQEVETPLINQQQERKVITSSVISTTVSPPKANSNSIVIYDDVSKIPALPTPKTIQRLEMGLNITGKLDPPKSDVGVKSVKDLASRFERLASGVPNVSSATTLENQQSSKESNALTSPQPTMNCPPLQLPCNFNTSSLSSLRSGTTSTGRIVALLGTNLRVGQEGVPTSQSQPISSPSPIPSSPSTPSSIILSPTSAAYIHTRPEKPPDYQTAMKRLGLRKAEMSNMLQQNRLSNSSIGSNFTSQQIMNGEELSTSPSRRRAGPKKCVSFSDEVVLVASAEAEEEEHFPNPLLERILAKSNILSMNSNTQEMSTS